MPSRRRARARKHARGGGFRRLHVIGGCWRIPEIDIKEYRYFEGSEDWDFDAVSKGCWPGVAQGELADKAKDIREWLTERISSKSPVAGPRVAKLLTDVEEENENSSTCSSSGNDTE